MAATELYTRGQPGEADNRGESLVQQHLDRMQQQKETVAMEKLRVLMPQLGDMVRAMALANADWDVDQAVNMLRSFQVAHLDKKKKKSSRHKERLDGSSSGKKHKKKHKQSAKDKSNKHKKRSKESKDKDKKRKKQQQYGDGSDDEAAAQGRHKLTHSQDFGKYGYIRDTDLHTKHGEFQLWCQDVKKVNVELLGRQEEKELFKEYMEDYNTGTLPHKKYYDLEAFERSEALKAAQARGSGGDKRAAAAFDARADEEALRRERIEQRRQAQQDRLNDAYNLLKNTDRAKDMREQELLRAEMALAYKTGDRARAQKIFDRLQPDDQKK
eukprot:gene7910-8106_t